MRLWCIGHFLLTNLLLDDLKQTASDGGDARIIVVTSSFHDPDNMSRKSKWQQLTILVASNCHEVISELKLCTASTAGVKLGCVRLCRMEGNTVWSYMASNTP